MNRRTLSILLASLFVLGAVGLATTPGSLPGLGAPSREAGALADQGMASDPVGAALQNAGGQPPPALRQQLRNLDTARALEAVADEDLSPSQRALRYIEEASRHQVASLGLTWSDEVFVPEHDLPSASIRALAQRHGGVVGPEQEEALAAMDALPPEVVRALADVVDAFHAMDLAAERTATESDPERLAALADGGTPEALAAAGVDPSDILAARLRLAEASLALRDILGEAGAEVPSLVVPASHGEDPSFEQPGVVCINAHDADNVYASDCTLLLDTSEEGDTRYHNNAGGKKGGGASALIDFGGNDEFGDPANPRSNGVNGGANGGNAVGFLMSLGEGSDRYTAGDGGVNGGASGAVGIGFLFDEGGDDVYTGQDGGVNGGVGDLPSDPVGTLGLLVDVGGDDQYLARDRGTNGGNSEGLAAVGFLLDMDGDDIYQARNSGTNGGSKVPTGLFYSFGNLFDLEGDDQFLAGSGGVNGGSEFIVALITSVSTGFLYDGGGSDFYQDDSIKDQQFAACLFIPNGPCEEEDTQGGTCSDCTIVAKGASTPTTPGAGLQLDLPGAGTGPLDLIQTDCDQFASQMTCWVQVGDTRVTVISPYATDGDGQVGATGDPLNAPLTVTLVGQPRVEGQEVCFQVTSTPSGGEDARLVGLDGSAPDAEGVLCATSGEGGEANVILVLGSAEGTYTTRAWNRAVGKDNPGFVEFTSEAKHVSGFRIERSVQGSRQELPAGTGFTADVGTTLFAAGLDETGAYVADVEVQWSLSPAERGSFGAPVASRVTLTGDKAGPATLTASRDGVDVSVPVVVVPGALSELRIRTAAGGGGEWLQSPPTFDVEAGLVLTLHAASYDARGNLRQDEPTDWSVPTGSSNPDCGRFAGGQATATGTSAAFHATAAADCTQTITAKADADNQVTSALEFRTHAGPLGMIKVRDAPGGGGSEVTAISLRAGETRTLHVAGYDAVGNYHSDLGDGDGLVWNTGGLGPVVSDGGAFVFTAQTAGAQTVTVHHAGLGPSSAYSIGAAVAPADAFQVGFQEVPSSVVAGEAFGFTTQVQDAFGNVVSDHPDGTVTLGLRDGGTLQGTLTSTTTDGVATFDDLLHTRAGTLRVAATLEVAGQDDLVGETSVLVVPAALDHVVVRDGDGRTGPFTVIAGEPRTFVAAGHDAYGNRLPSDATVEWVLEGVGSLTAQDGSPGTTFLSPTQGDATLTARHADVADASAAVRVVPDELDHVTFRDAPDGGGNVVASLGTLRAGVERTLFAAGYDEHGNFILDLTDDWVVDPPTLGSFDETGTRFTAEREGSGTLSVTGGGATAVLDLAVVPGDAERLAFADEPPTGLVAGETWPALEVRVEDAYGNLVTHPSRAVTLGPGPGFDGDLTGTLVRTTQAGSATFDDVSYPVAEGVWVVAEATGLQSAAAGPHAVAPAALHEVVVRDVASGGAVSALDLVAGDRVTLHATGLDVFGNAVDADAAWSLEGVGRVVPSGDLASFTASDAGDAILVVDLDGTRATLDVSVAPGALERIEVTDAGGAVEQVRLSAGTARSLHATGFDAWGNEAQATLSWSVDPPGLGSVSPATGAEATFTAAGRGGGSVTVRDGEVSRSVLVFVEAEGTAPKAAFTASCAGLTCTFDASDSAPGDAPVATHAWDFGDGATAEGRIRTHVFDEGGEREVTLVVTDTEGRTAEATRTVAPAPPAAPELRLRIQVEPDAPSAGDAFVVGAVVENVGTATASDVTVVFLLDGERVHVEVGGELAPGASRRANATATALPGAHTLRVEAVGWAEEAVPFTVAEPSRERVDSPTADAPAPGLLVPLATLLGALWVVRRGRLVR